MNPNKLFPLIITRDLDATRRFYTEVAGFEVSMEQPGNYLQVRYGPEDGPELAFMTPDAAPALGPVEAFGGKGFIVSIPTENADDAHRAVKKRGATILAEPSDKPWGWRSFLTVDPNGVVLDFFHVRGDAAAVDATG